ncbi:LuxR C-terminal-related transcriptional regulator [Chitinophagaceae bacterium LWZ2-11]
MKLELFNNEAGKIWKRAAGEPVADILQVELDLYKKLLVYFQIGECCYFVFNFQRLEFDLVSKELETLLGYKPEDVTTEFIMEHIHPDDRAWFLSCQDAATKFIASLPPEKQLKYKMRFDFRIRKKDDTYLRVMMQVVVIHNDGAGGIYRTLIIFTDISHLKQQGKPALSFIGMEGEPSYINVDVTCPVTERNEVISKREKEVLSLLMQGKVSKEIGALLNISKQTVDKHRKNMLHKNKLNTTAELISKAFVEGWV